MAALERIQTMAWTLDQSCLDSGAVGDGEAKELNQQREQKENRNTEKAKHKESQVWLLFDSLFGLVLMADWIPFLNSESTYMSL